MTQTLPAPSRSSARSVTPITPARRWTKARQVEFLQVLASSHNVAEAARAVGMSRQSAYRLRNRLRDEPFGMAWEAAFRRQFSALAEVALDRALNGVEVPHYYKGELVGTHRQFDERLTVALLALQSRLTEIPRRRSNEERDCYFPDDFEGLLYRVETGKEYWDDDR
ncbi:MAG: hypothetical protein R3E18_10825 [Sphingomonadaceae bacterium]|nr:hypothetical protein [Sphingomonadaceae bacterium]